eukprot:53907_1
MADDQLLCYNMSGYLFKQSKHLKQYRNRWLTLNKDGSLSSYKNEQSKKPTEILTDFKCIRELQHDNGFELFAFNIGPSAKTRSRIFIASSRANARMWINAIKKTTEYMIELKRGDETVKICFTWQDGLHYKHIRVETINRKRDQIHLKINKTINQKLWSYQLPMNDVMSTSMIVHQISDKNITCEYMKHIKSQEPLHCPIYYNMKKKYEFNKNNLNHLNEFTHFINEMNEKPECNYNDKCKAYIRMEQGTNRLDDE